MTELIIPIEPEKETIPDNVAEAFAYFAKNADVAYYGTRHAGDVSISHYPGEQVGSYLFPENYLVTVTEGPIKRRLQCRVRGDKAVLIVKGTDKRGADGAWYERSSQYLEPESAEAISFIGNAQKKFEAGVAAEREKTLAEAALVNS